MIRERNNNRKEKKDDSKEGVVGIYWLVGVERNTTKIGGC